MAESDGEITRPGEDRRDFVKKMAVAGGIAWTAPTLYGSVMSAAAACSGSQITATSRNTFLDNSSGTSAASGSFSPATSGDRFLVIFNLWVNNNVTPAPTVVGSAGFGAFTQLVAHNYSNVSPAGNSPAQYWLYVYQGVASSTAARTVTITFGHATGSTNATNGNLIGHVVELAPTTTVAGTTVTGAAAAASAVAVNYLAPPVAKAEILIGAGVHDISNPGGGIWGVTTPATGNTTVANTYSNLTNDDDLSLGTFSRTVAVQNHTLGVPVADAGSLGAAAIQLSC